MYKNLVPIFWASNAEVYDMKAFFERATTFVDTSSEGGQNEQCMKDGFLDKGLQYKRP